MRIDLHLHTNESDGTDTPATLMRLVAEEGLDVIAVTDHDTVSGLPLARAACPSSVRFIDGVELSCATGGEGGFRCHILGYGIDPDSEAIRHAIELGVDKRRHKLLTRLDYLDTKHGIRFTDDELRELFSYNSVGKLHLARYIIAKGFAKTIVEAIDTYLGIKLPDDRIDTGVAIRAILDAGGIPVYAHPLGGEREPRLDREELMRRVGMLKELGIMGLEAYYSRYTALDSATVLGVARTHGLCVSGGSDYHGQNKTVRLGCLCADGTAVASDDITLLSALGIR